MTKTILQSGIGISLVEATNQIPPTSNQVELIKVVIQLIIAIGTLIKIFKKPKEK